MINIIFKGICLVLVADEKKRRGHWPMGLIEEVFPDGNAHVGSVKVIPW